MGLFNIMNSKGNNEDVSSNVLQDMVSKLREIQKRQTKACLIDDYLLNMATSGVCDQDMRLLKNMFLGLDYSGITFDFLKSQEVAVSRTLYSLGDDRLNAQPIYMCTGSVPTDAATFLPLICSTQARRVIENNFYSSNVKELVKPNTLHSYAMAVTHENYPLVWPLENVDFKVANSIVHDPSNNLYFYIRKSVNENTSKDASFMKQETCTRGMLFEGWVFTHDVQNQCVRYLALHVCNVAQKGWGSMSLLWNRIFEQRADSLRNNIISILNMKIELTENDASIMSTLKINIQRQNEMSMYNKRTGLLNTQPGCKLKRIIYTSRFKNTPSAEDLNQIETISRRNNTRDNISGVLMSGHNLIYQVLEGEASLVDQTFDRILKDRRHYDVQCVSEHFDLTEEDRQYPNWSMKVVNLSEYHSYFEQMMKQFMKKSFNLFDVDAACVF
ncbi:sensor of blue-light using FAD [Acrasis kona]